MRVERWCLVAAMMGWLPSCLAAPTVAENDNSVEGTVKEVEELLKKDPGLPRLTRGEILSLIEEARQKGGRDLVVVLPFSGNSSGALEELYTKAPVTEMVREEIKTSTTKRPIKRRRKQPTKRPVYVTVPQTSSTNAQTTTETPSTSTEGEDWVPLGVRDTFQEMEVKIPTEAPIFVTLPQRGKTSIATAAPTTPGPDVAFAAESLAPDMKDLLVSFGLLKSPEGFTQAPVVTEPPKEHAHFSPTVDPTSYLSFKPLPESEDDMSEDMKSFLAGFGLFPETKRRSNKALKEVEKKTQLEEFPPINEDILSQDMKDVLEDLGIMEADRKRRKMKSKHVFNPVESTAEYNQTLKVEKINRLLRKIKELARDNRTSRLSNEELRGLLSREVGEEVVGTLLRKDQPDPLSLDELAQALEADKNEVKRQEPSTTPEAPTTASVSSTEKEEGTTRAVEALEGVTGPEKGLEGGETTEPSTERTPSFDELNESFGGETPSSTTTPRPNGLYFLLDWNSFLDVGLESRRVNLQFNPKVGDPRLFLPVTVP